MTETAAPTRLAPGDEAPSFTLPDATGECVSLSDYRGRGLVVFFYPAAGTPGCTTEACGFRDALAEFDAAGYDVLGVSPDQPEKLAEWAATEGLAFPLLADVDRTTLTAWGAYGEKTMYGKKTTGVIRSTVVVDPDGRVEKAFYNIKAAGHVDKVRRELGVGS